MISLASVAFRILQADFSRWGQTLAGEQEVAIRSFLSVLEKGLQGELPPKFHLLALDPGMGKTTACIAFIRAWRMCGYRPESSILVGISTLAELQSFVEGAGLPPSDFGVRTSDPAMNSLGLPRERHDGAKVLFTTQAMIRRKTNDKAFADASDFHYQGTPRSLRIWDEDILPSEGKTVRLDDLQALPSFLRVRFPQLVEELMAFVSMVTAVEAGQTVQVPLTIRVSPSTLSAACGILSLDRHQAALETMQLMAGADMLVQNGDYFGKELVGVRVALPDDVAPLVVVDASARVRDAYSVWQAHRGNLIRLPAAGNSYHQLNVHHWQHRSGKEALDNDETRENFAAAIVEAFDRDATGHWLILTYKEAQEGLKAAIERLSPPVSEDRLHWLHWGIHRSTNDYRDVEHIIIVGLNRYRQTDYLALSLAAAGLPVSTNDYPDPAILRDGEIKHHLLQAICRISVRKARQGIAAPANAFVIAKLADAEDLFESIFPGHSYTKWQEDEPDPNDAVQAAINHVRASFANGAETVRKKHVREAIGIRKQDMTKVLNNDAFVAFLREAALVSEGQQIRPASSEFDPVEEDAP